MNKCLNVSGDPVTDSDTVPDPVRDTGKTRLEEVCTVPVLQVSLCEHTLPPLGMEIGLEPSDILLDGDLR